MLGLGFQYNICFGARTGCICKIIWHDNFHSLQTIQIMPLIPTSVLILLTFFYKLPWLASAMRETRRYLSRLCM